VNDPTASASLDGVWPLVGRDALVVRVSDAVLARGARMVVLTGETGVGKSRIAAAAAEAAERAGDLVIGLHGEPILSVVPLGVAGPLLPLGATPVDPVALLAAVRSHLAALAGDRRVVVEAQSAGVLDPITSDLLAQLVAARAVTLLATIRTGDPLPDALIAQWSPDDCTRFEVPPLTAAASEPHPASPRLSVLRGTALARLGRLADSLEALEAAATQAAGGDPEVVLQVASATAFTHASFIDGTAAALAVLDALPAPLAQSPVVALMRSTFLRYEHRVAEARRLLDEVAPAFTGSAVERGLYAHALAPVLSAQGEDDRALSAVTLALDEARSAAGSPHWPTPLPAVEVTRAEVLLQAGRLDEAFASAIDALRLATASDDQFITRYIEFVIGRIEMERGRLEAAARWFQEVVGGAVTRGPESLVPPAAGALAMVRFAQGDDEAARAALALVPARAPERNPTTVIATSIGLARAGELSRARDLLVGKARELEQLGFRYLAGLYLFALARFGDAANAAASLARLVANGAGVYTARQARHAAAEAQGDRAELIAVGDEWEAHGAVLYAAEAFASAARLAQAAGDSRAAIGLQARADGLTASAQGAATPLLRFTAVLTPLTPREREIAELAARGASSKDIADRLFLSVRTVDNHLQSIYGKLGIRGRRELADAIG
jgi:ATP/maltotriose-dependent transcriptional regulator MalT